MLLRLQEEALKIAEKEVLPLLGDWSNPKWDELDWSKIKEMQTRDLLDRRSQRASDAQLGHCFDCPQFVKHVSEVFKCRIILMRESSQCAMMNG